MSRSQTLFEDASHYLVGGVNSPVRAFKSVGGEPIFFKHGNGAYMTSEDDKTYIDYVQSWGPLILGHANPEVVNAIKRAAELGTSFGAPTASETILAKKVQELVPSLEKLRFVSSGTEATMSALRLARGYSKKSLIIKFDGAYHGHADSLLVAAGSGGLTLSQPDSAGVPKSFVQHTRVLPYNDMKALENCFKEEGEHIAGIIIEPVSGNMGVVPATPQFLAQCRSLCDRYNAVLIFDEVMTGFRAHLNGAQAHYHITPDLSCLGKVVGGGMPCAAYGGKAEIMDKLAPLGPVYQAGTLSGNPCAMAAGLATLSQLNSGNFKVATERTQALVEGVTNAAKEEGIPLCAQSIGTMFTFFYTEKSTIQNLEDVKTCDMDRFRIMYHHLLKHGIYMAPSQYEANFMSLCHTVDDIQTTISAFRSGFKELSQD